MDSHARPFQRFLVIPVIDLRAGLVVHARRGDRAAYRPLSSPLSPSAAPVDVVRGLLSLHPFRTLYVADLDAIQHRRVQHDAIFTLQREFPQLDVWLDCGIRSVADYAAASRLARPVLGSETLAARSVRAMLARAAADSARPPALSIDVRDDIVLGAPQLLAAARAWPERVIAMSLKRVGAAAGPDLALIARLLSLAPRAHLFAAGGVRNLADLVAARDAGCAGALVATSLHDGALGATDLAQAATWHEGGDENESGDR